MTTLLFHSKWDDPDSWREGLAARCPDIELRLLSDIGAKDRVRYAFIEHPPPGLLASLPNLALILSPGAGVDGLLGASDLPDVPIVKVVQPNMTLGIVQYAVLHVLRHHREMPAYRAQQHERLWRELKQPAADQRRIGVMGLGTLGRASAKALAGLGFQVAGWSRGRKRIAGIECFAGPDGLAPFLRRTEILACLLALTPETEGIVNARTLALLPEGASFVNAARGRHQNEADLLAALDSGRLAHATLDVFHTEPLAPESRFWDHPRVTVTPHRAGNSSRVAVRDQMLDAIARDRAGRPIPHLARKRRGY